VAVNVIGERWAEEFRVRNEGVRTGILVLLYLHQLYGITYLTVYSKTGTNGQTVRQVRVTVRTCVRVEHQSISNQQSAGSTAHQPSADEIGIALPNFACSLLVDQMQYTVTRLLRQINLRNPLACK
jgi:hypothetical protein